MVKGAAAVEWFDVWEGERCVSGAAPKTKPRRHSEKAAERSGISR
jgi:hypothetical protein